MIRQLPTAKLVAAIVPCCPDCRSKNYRYVSENTAQGFLLRSLNCEGCGADILETYFDVVGGNMQAGDKNSTEFLLMVVGALLLLLTGIVILSL